MDWSGLGKTGSIHYGHGPSYNTSGIQYEEGMRLATLNRYSTVFMPLVKIDRTPRVIDGATWMIPKEET